jgi:tetratricopeptide (TPR) repeat protein
MIKSLRNWILGAAFCLFAVTYLFGEGSAIYIENDDVKPYLKLAAEYETSQQWRAAIEQYEFVLSKYPAALCKTDSGKYVSLRQYYLEKLKSYPPAGRQVYKGLFDSPSQALFNQALIQLNSGRDTGLLKEIVNIRLFSSIGSKAAVLAGDYYSELNEIDTAVRYYQKAAEGANWRDGDARDIELRLERCVKLAASDAEPPTDSLRWLKWGGNNANSLTIRDADEPITGTLALAWQHLFSDILAVSIKKEDAGRIQFPLCYPAVSGDYLYLNLGKCVIAIKLNSGKIENIFPSTLNLNPGARRVDRTGSLDNTGGIPSRSFITLSSAKADRRQDQAVAPPRYLYTTMLRTEWTEKTANGLTRKRKVPEPRLHLVCLEIPYSGSLSTEGGSASGGSAELSARYSRQYPSQTAELSMMELWTLPLEFAESCLSAPLVYEGRVFMGVFAYQNNEWQLSICCYDGLTGAVIYSRLIYALNIDSNTAAVRAQLVTPPYLAESKGIIYCLTPSVLSASESESGEVIWLNHYSADKAVDYSGGRNQSASQLPAPLLNYPVIKGNTIAMQSIYENKIQGFDLLTGRKKWQQTVAIKPRGSVAPSGRPPIIGCLNEAVVFQGDEITAINIVSGKLAWKAPLWAIDALIDTPRNNRDSAAAPPAKSPQIGQGFITSRYAYLPTAQGVAVLSVPPVLRRSDQATSLEPAPVLLEFPPKGSMPLGALDKTTLYKIGERLLLISDRGICFYKIEK